MSTSSRSDLWGGFCWVAVGAFILIESLRMERFDNMGATLYTYPGFVPGVISSVILLLGLVMIFRGLKSKVAVDTDAEPLVNRRFLISLACMLVFSLILLAHAHFLVATALFVGVFTFLFANEETPLLKRLTSASINGVISSCVVFFLFQEVFLVRLP
jgi:uncharacterized Tic20 family protein